MKTQLITARIKNSVTLDDVKNHLRITATDEDDYLSALMDAAQEFCEDYTNRKYEAETWKLLLDEFPKVIELPFSPVSSVTHVKYYDTDENQQTLSTDDYETSLNAEPVTIKPVTDSSFPSTYDMYEAVEVQFVCGASAPAICPMTFRQAILILIADMYQKRESTVHRYPDTVDMLLQPLKVHY